MSGLKIPGSAHEEVMVTMRADDERAKRAMSEGTWVVLHGMVGNKPFAMRMAFTSSPSPSRWAGCEWRVLTCLVNVRVSNGRIHSPHVFPSRHYYFRSALDFRRQ